MADRRRPRRPDGEAAPDLRVVFTTFYAGNAIVHPGRLDADIQMTGKPRTYADRAARVRAFSAARSPLAPK
jgi:hypothetical protein